MDVVPLWTLAPAFVAGLVVGVVVGRLTKRRTPPALADKGLAPAADFTAADVPVEPEPLGPGAEDVVAELERRYQGRRANGEADKPAGGRREQS